MPEELATRGEQTREQILQAALQLFNDRGYHGTSMRQIAERAGVALGSIYNHFPNKEQIFLVVLMRFHPAVEILPALESAQGETVEELVRDAASRIVSQIDQRREFLNLMFIEMVEFKAQHIQELFQVIFPQVLAYATQSLQGRPELRPIPVPTLLRAFIGLFFSYLISELLIGTQFPSEAQENALEGFIDIFLHGILKSTSLAEENIPSAIPPANR